MPIKWKLSWEMCNMDMWIPERISVLQGHIDADVPCPPNPSTIKDRCNDIIFSFRMVHSCIVRQRTYTRQRTYIWFYEIILSLHWLVCNNKTSSGINHLLSLTHKYTIHFGSSIPRQTDGRHHCFINGLQIIGDIFFLRSSLWWNVGGLVRPIPMCT